VERTGRRIGNIRVEELLGRGGFGDVYRGRDELLERPVALKFLHSRRQADPDRGLLREARLLCKLDHPNVRRVYDLEEDEGRDVLVLELLDGCTLDEAIPRLAGEARLRVAHEVAAGLEAAHRGGIVHRDLKPLNVFLTDSGTAKILDFGLARGAGVAGLGETGGTVHYMSPEQARGEPSGAAGDLWALGVLLHELFTGKLPFAEASTFGERLTQVRAADVRIAHRPGPLANLITALLSPNPDQRPTASQAVAALRGVADAPRRRQLRRRLAAGLLGAALLATVAALGAHRLGRDSRIAAPAGARHVVAVLPPVSPPGLPAAVQEQLGVLADLLTRRMTGLPGVATVDAALVAEARDRGPAVDLRQRLGASLIVEAAVQETGTSWVANLRASEASRSFEQVVAADSFAGLIAESATWLAGLLGVALQPQPGDLTDPLEIQLYALARHRNDTRGTQAARPFLETLLDLNPRFTYGHILLANVFWDRGEVATAVAMWSEALASPAGLTEHDRAETIYNLAWSATERGAFAEAAEWARELDALAVRIPTRDRALETAGNLAAARGRHAEAAQHFAQLVELNRRSGDPLYLLITLVNQADAHLATGDTVGAAPLLAEAKSLADPMASEPWRVLVAVAQLRADAVAGVDPRPAALDLARRARALDNRRLELAAREVACEFSRPLDLAEVDELVKGHRALANEARATYLRALAARRLRERGDSRLAAAQIEDVVAHGGRSILEEIARDLLPLGHG
jgi:tetratricopeptide (TPR) repeat protein/predicted Ser/Thr protein kinase